MGQTENEAVLTFYIEPADPNKRGGKASVLRYKVAVAKEKIAFQS